MTGIGDQLLEPSGYIEAVLGASASVEDTLLNSSAADAEEAATGEDAP